MRLTTFTAAMLLVASLVGCESDKGSDEEGADGWGGDGGSGSGGAGVTCPDSYLVATYNKRSKPHE